MADAVRYIGLSGIRRITKQAWEKAGISGQDTVIWDARNRYSVPVENLTDNALEVLKQDKEFVLPGQSESETTDPDVQPTGEATPSGATTTATSNQPTGTRGSRSGGRGGSSS